MNDAVAEWALECVVYANAAGMIALPYHWDDEEVDQLLAMYGAGMLPVAAAQAMFTKH